MCNLFGAKKNNKKIIIFFFKCFIDELDKTLAEYDTTTGIVVGPASTNSTSVNHLNTSLSTRILANDANAASIRTRYKLFFFTYE